MQQKPAENFLEPETQCRIEDRIITSSGCSPSASGAVLTASLENDNRQVASTKIFENSGAAFSDPHSEVIGPSQTVETSTAIDPVVHGQDRSLNQQKIPSTVRLEKYQTFNTRYMIGEEIGNGGMGLVYRGWDLQLQRDVAIKIIREDHQGNEQHLLRFLREARIASQLRHPGILGIHDFDVEPSGSAYIIMDLITGKTMEQAIAETIADESKRQSMLTTFFQICQAMAFAHANGVVHRDLKPTNIMVGDYGIATVLDWGLAKVLGTNAAPTQDSYEERLITMAQPSIDDSFDAPNDKFHTLFGTVMGTPYYLAPEQARGEAVDYRADVFSLGAILCHLLTGNAPFQGSKLFEVYQKSVSGDVSHAFEQLDRCGAPIPIVQLAKQCLEPDVDRRPGNASGLVETLREYLESGQRRAEEELVRFFDLSLDLFCIATPKAIFGGSMTISLGPSATRPRNLHPSHSSSLSIQRINRTPSMR